MWEQLLNDVLTTSIKYLLPILLGFIIAWVGLLIKTEWENIKAKRPDIITLVQEYAPYLVAYLEQLRKTNKIDLWTIEAETERLIIEFLKTKGIVLDLENPIWLLIKTIVEAEVNKLPSFDSIVTTKSVSTVKTSPEITYTPNVVYNGYVSTPAVDNVAIPTSVVTTTTNSTVSSDSGGVVVPVVPSS